MSHVKYPPCNHLFHVTMARFFIYISNRHLNLICSSINHYNNILLI